MICKIAQLPLGPKQTKRSVSYCAILNIRRFDIIFKSFVIEITKNGEKSIICLLQFNTKCKTSLKENNESNKTNTGTDILGKSTEIDKRTIEEKNKTLN